MEMKHKYVLCCISFSLFFLVVVVESRNAERPDFSEHAAGLQCDEHDAVVRSSHHLHRSTLDDVHLFTDVALPRDEQNMNAEEDVVTADSPGTGRSSGRWSGWCPQRWRFSSPGASCPAARTRLERTRIPRHTERCPEQVLDILLTCFDILFYGFHTFVTNISWTHPACPEPPRCSCTRSGLWSGYFWESRRYSCSQRSHP